MIDDEDALAALQALASAVRSISHGGVTGPEGLEMLSMSISGQGIAGHDSLCRAIRDAGWSIESGLRAVAEALSPPTL